MPSFGQLLWDARRGKYHRPQAGPFVYRQKVTFKDMVSGIWGKLTGK